MAAGVGVTALLEHRATLADYLAAGGGSGLERARSLGSDGVIAELTRSGLRGRGGAGFPTGVKWASVRDGGIGTRYVVCNAAEGEPATFKDRLLIRRNPYQVVEGVAIACLAVGARVAYIGVKASFERESTRLVEAIVEMRSAGMLDGLAIELALGPDRYLFGEETALLGVIEKRGPFPRVVRPFMLGLFGHTYQNNPTVENNTETLANVPYIVANGADWLRGRGTDDSPGSMLFTVCGDVAREGVFELPMGTPLRHLIEDVAGAEDMKVIVPGASSPVVLPSMLDVPMDVGSFRRAGTGLGSGGFAVFDSSACAVSILHLFARFLYVESCGQCPSCKRGGEGIDGALARLESGEAVPGDLENITRWAGEVTDGQKCALPSGQNLVTLSMLVAFASEFAAHLGRGCPSSRELVLPKISDYDEDNGRFVYDSAYSRVTPQWTSAA
jgi:NADH:ubiquinone oxidoreductase subunit F (NADH-binding)